MWVFERELGKDELFKKNYTEGFYIFGGLSEDNQPQNDLWLARPNYGENAKFLNKISCDYIGSP